MITRDGILWKNDLINYNADSTLVITSEQIINKLQSYDKEREWFEFKRNWFVADELGEYISALSNSAAIEGRKTAYFVWGIDDKTHDCRRIGFGK